MPDKELERRLWDEAKEKFPRDKKRQRAYVYGTLKKIKKAQNEGKCLTEVRFYEKIRIPEARKRSRER